MLSNPELYNFLMLMKILQVNMRSNVFQTIAEQTKYAQDGMLLLVLCEKG